MGIFKKITQKVINKMNLDEDWMNVEVEGAIKIEAKAVMVETIKPDKNGLIEFKCTHPDMTKPVIITGVALKRNDVLRYEPLEFLKNGGKIDMHTAFGKLMLWNGAIIPKDLIGKPLPTVMKGPDLYFKAFGDEDD